MNLNQTLEKLNGKQPLKLISLWKKRMSTLQEGKFVKDLTGKEQGQLKQFQQRVGEPAYQVLDWALQNWNKVVERVISEKGVGGGPTAPHVGFILQYHDVLVNSYAKSMSVQKPVIKSPIVSTKVQNDQDAPMTEVEKEQAKQEFLKSLAVKEFSTGD